MITIIHGENLVISRNWLAELLSSKQSILINRLHAKELTIPDLESILGNQSLFVSDQVIVIENLHSLPKSAKKTAFLELLNTHDSPHIEIILWEKKKLTATDLKKFPQAKTQEAKLSNAIFDWIDIWHSKDKKKVITALRLAAKQDGIEICQNMLNRQIRMLLQVKAGKQLKGHPFYIQKIQNQARLLTEDKLKMTHQALTELDFHHKTGQLKTSLKVALEQLMLQ